MINTSHSEGGGDLKHHQRVSTSGGEWTDSKHHPGRGLKVGLQKPGDNYDKSEGLTITNLNIGRGCVACRETIKTSQNWLEIFFFQMSIIF